MSQNLIQPAPQKLAEELTGELAIRLDRRAFMAGSARLATITGSALAAPALLPSPTWARGAKSETFKYGSHRLDIYPARSDARNNSLGLAPVLAFVHGGAWRMGSKSRVGKKPDYFTKQGFTFVSIGYTLYPAANAATQASQIGEATHFIANNIARFGGDPDRVALLGHSAGCHLSALATLSGKTDGVKALVCNDTRAYDLPYLARLYGNRLPILYARPFSRRKYWDAWSPINHAGTNDHPPVLVAWSRGTNRDVISKNFVNRLDSVGAEVYTFDGVRKYNHLSINSKMGKRGDALTSALTSHLDKVLNRPICPSPEAGQETVVENETTDEACSAGRL